MSMTKESYEKIIAAENTLYDYCESDECDRCIVTTLIDDAA